MKLKFIKGDLVKSNSTNMIVEVMSCNRHSFAGVVIEEGSSIYQKGEVVLNFNLESFERK